MKRPQRGSTIKQYAYATRRLSPGKATTKKEIALLSGYSMTMANNPKAKIEDTDGYQNAIKVLAGESNNLLLSVIAEFKTRGLKEFSNSDLVKALNAISGAWDRIETKRAPDKLKNPAVNPLRAVFTQRVETRTAVLESAPTAASAPPSRVPQPAYEVYPGSVVVDVEKQEREDDSMDF